MNPMENLQGCFLQQPFWDTEVERHMSPKMAVARHSLAHCFFKMAVARNSFAQRLKKSICRVEFLSYTIFPHDRSATSRGGMGEAQQN